MYTADISVNVHKLFMYISICLQNKITFTKNHKLDKITK